MDALHSFQTRPKTHSLDFSQDSVINKEPNSLTVLGFTKWTQVNSKIFTSWNQTLNCPKNQQGGNAMVKTRLTGESQLSKPCAIHAMRRSPTLQRRSNLILKPYKNAIVKLLFKIESQRKLCTYLRVWKRYGHQRTTRLPRAGGRVNPSFVAEKVELVEI